MNSVMRAGGCGVHENVVLRESFDILLQLGKLGFAAFFLLFEADSVHLLDVGDLLVLPVHDLPLLLKSRNKFLTLGVGEKELLFILLIFFFNLHFSDQFILVVDFLLDLLHVLGHLSKVSLFQIILVFVSVHLRRSKDVLHRVGNDVVLV